VKLGHGYTENTYSVMIDSAKDRRQSVRVVGPFDGVRPGMVDMPIQIHDLSTGGCFVNSIHQPPARGQIFTIKIELPTGHTIVAQCEMAFARPGFGYGVKFCQLSDECRVRLARAIELVQQTAVEEK